MVAATLVVPVDMSALGFGVWLLLKRWVILDEIAWALTRRRVNQRRKPSESIVSAWKLLHRVESANRFASRGKCFTQRSPMDCPSSYFPRYSPYACVIVTSNLNTFHG